MQILKQDYQKFPADQSYELYDQKVYFKDPLTQFSGIERYQAMIGFISKWFKNIQLDLHKMERQEQRIDTEWTLSWTSPLPWRPRVSISGRSELLLNAEDKIISHIDYWYCSRWNVLRQHLVKSIS